MERTINILTPSEKKVISKRFFDNKTCKDVGKEFDVTQERIRQIEAKALRKILEHSSLNILRNDFLIELNKRNNYGTKK